MRLRSFVFTINNWTDQQYQSLFLFNYKYVVIGKEVGESGTPHLQGYIELKNQLSFISIKKKLPTAHIEQRQGSPKQASDYCKKDGDFFEDGELSHQGKRTDIDTVIELVKDGNNDKDIAVLQPATYFKFHKHIKEYRNAILTPRNEVPEVLVLWGETGTGKSKLARDLCFADGEDPYIWGPENDKWWDGYSGQKYIIMEEFRGQLKLGYMLRLLDRYDMKVEYKGGMCEFCGTYIVITSPKHPENWFTTAENDSIEQLLRRITKIQKMEINV